MALNFTPVAKPGAAGSAPRATLTPEFLQEITEAWEFCKSNPNHDLSTNFPTEALRDSWVKMARSYAPDNGLRYRSVSQEKGVSALTFRLMTQEEYDKLKAEREAYNKDLAERKAKGEVIKRGRKAAA